MKTLMLRLTGATAIKMIKKICKILDCSPQLITLFFILVGHHLNHKAKQC
jgi:hypothetical protein